MPETLQAVIVRAMVPGAGFKLARQLLFPTFAAEAEQANC
jgi:hypothetical protein